MALSRLVTRTLSILTLIVALLFMGRSAEVAAIPLPQGEEEAVPLLQQLAELESRVAQLQESRRHQIKGIVQSEPFRQAVGELASRNVLDNRTWLIVTKLNEVRSYRYHLESLLNELQDASFRSDIAGEDYGQMIDELEKRIWTAINMSKQRYSEEQIQRDIESQGR